MPVFTVAAAAYYRGLPGSVRFSSPSTFTGTEENIARCEAPMSGLIARYGLAGATVLSLGCGTAFEEYWFHRAGCRLTLNDLDVPNHASEPYLRSLPAAPQDSPTALTFYVEDAAETVSRFADGRFDVLYVSSFPPDEERRGNIQSEFTSRRSFMARLRDPITWPAGTATHLDLLVRAFQTVRPGGWIVFQHYAFGVPLNQNPHYLDDVVAQFGAHGATLTEAWCFRKATSKHLLVAVRGGRESALQQAGTLRAKPGIREFYGRYPFPEIRTDVVKVFDVAGSGSMTASLGGRWATHLSPMLNAPALVTMGKKLLPPSARRWMRRTASRILATAEK